VPQSAVTDRRTAITYRHLFPSTISDTFGRHAPNIASNRVIQF